MGLDTIALVLIAATAHALWNVAAKYKRGDTLLFVWAYTCASALVCLPIALVLMAEQHQALDGRLLVASVVSALLHIVYSLILQAGYDRAELGVVYAVARGSGPLLTMVIAVTLLGERLGLAAMCGALLIVIGIFVVVGQVFGGAGRLLSPGVFWGVATGTSIAGYTLWDSHAVTGWHLPPVSYYAGTLLLQGLILTPFALRRRHGIAVALRANAAPILAVALLSPLAYGLVLTAMQRAPVALVAPMRESSIVIGSFLAWWFFHEGHLARRILGGLIVLAGITVISLF